jgi:hypothetical protein
MPLKRLTKEFWNSKSEIIEAATRGWNPQQRLPALLREAYPDFKHLDFHFCSERDLMEMQSYGWTPLTPGDFDVDSFNNSDIPSRFGVVDAGGMIKWRDNYLLVMDRSFRDKLIAARHNRHEEQVVQSVNDQRFAMREDPRASEMLEYSESMLETAIIRPSMGGEPKRKPGRPSNKK